MSEPGRHSCHIHEGAAEATETAGLARGDALRESEERLRIALESAGHLFWEYDVPSGRVASRAAAALLGHEDERFRFLADWVQLVHPDDRERRRVAFEDHLSGRTPQFRCEYRARNAAGAWRWVLGAGRVLTRDAAGLPLHMCGTLTDVTETRQLRDRLQIADRLASVGTLAAGVAHEINNPLAFVTSNLGYLRDALARLARGDEPATAAGYGALQDAIRDALDGTARVRGIVQGLREFAQPSRGAARAPVDVRAEIAAAVGMTRNEIAHRATLALDLAEELPRVVAAPQELGQVLVNLLVNAAQAIPEGRAAWNEVRVTARAAQGEVVVEVRDSGAGIPSDALPHIFDPFFTTRGVGEGTGLGLSICHGIVVALGGRIEVDTVPGRGTSFRVTLPAAPSVAAPTPAPIPLPAPGRARVLVVDDEPLVGRSLVRLLQAAHDVTALASPAEALTRLAAGERWDVILCDLMMPEMSGMDLEARLVREAPDAVARIVYMTGGAFTERARAFLDGGRPFLEKPIDPSVLRAKVAEVANAARGLAA